MEKKTHYKMYKAGKNWVFAMLSTIALTGAMAMSSNTAKADTVAQSLTEQVTKIDTTSTTATSTQTANQVEKATNNTNESNATQTATVTAEQSSSKTATISSNQDNKLAAAASVATSEQNQNAQSTQVANNNEQSNTTQSSAVQKSEEPKVETPINTADNASQKNVNGNWYLVDNNTGKNLTGFQEIKDQNKVVYYAPSNAQMQYGWQNINNNKYYFDKFSGAMTTGQKHIDGSWYLFDNQGVMQTGFQKIADQNKTVHYDSNGKMQYGWQCVDNATRYFDTVTGAMTTGQKNINNHWYLFDNKGAMQRGFQNLTPYGEAKTVYYNQKGWMVYGQQNINGHWYNFDKVTGKMSTGFTYLADQKKSVYYSLKKSTLGQMQYGWQLLGKDHYYFDKITGAISKGEKNIDGHWYLFNNKGIMQTGFQFLDGSKRKVYYSPDKATLGQMQYGVQIINGNTYYFDKVNGAQAINKVVVGNDNTLKYYGKDGFIVKNTTLNINGKNYSFDGMGSLIGNGQLNIQGHWYLLKNKIVQTGFQNLSAYGENKTVYYASNGQMQYGQQQLNGHWYLFDKISGAMQTGFQNLSAYGENKTVYYASNGQMQYGQQQLNGHWYLFDKVNGSMQTGFKDLTPYGQNKTVYYASNGQMQYGARKINNNLYFFDTTTGAMYVRNFVNVNGQTYYAGNNGVLMAPRYVSQLTPINAGWGCAIAASAMLMSIKGENLNLWYAYSHEPQAGVFNGVGFTRVISANNLTNYMRQFDGGFRNISGSSIDQIKNLVNSGHPVLYYGYSSYEYSYAWKNHCKVIVGYSNGKFHIYDPCYYGQYDGPNTRGHGHYDLGADQWRTESQLAAEYYGNNGSGAVTIY